jgi:hypothetical protein
MDMSSDEEEEKPIRLEPIVREALTKKLDRSIDPSRAVHAIFGLYLPLLYWLNEEWVLQHIDEIFPKGDDEDSSWNFAAAWDAFLYGNRFYPDLINFLCDKYKHAIENLAKGYVTRPDVVGNLAIHLVWEYLLGEYDIKSREGQESLIFQFFQKCSPEHRTRAAWACWRILNDSPQRVENYWPKIRALWEWRNQVARAANHTNDFDIEMRHFAQILPLLPESETILSLWPLLEGLLPHITNMEQRDRAWDSVEEFLARKVENDPIRVIQYYSSMRERRISPFPSYFKSEHARRIIEVAAANKESRDLALSLIDWIARNEKNHQYRAIYERYAQ